MSDKIRVFVSGASDEMERASRFIDALNAHPHCEALDWPANIRAVGSANRGVPGREARRSAARSFEFARDCDVMLFLVPAVPTRGAWVELGVALLSGKACVAIAGRKHDIDGSIFCSLASVVIYEEPGECMSAGRAQEQADASAAHWLQGFISSQRQSDAERPVRRSKEP